jgi:integrase
MSEHAVYLRLTTFTTRVFGMPLNPHLFRRIDGTTISVLAPEQIDTARALLGHSSVKTTQESYIAANGIVASRRHAKIIATLRRRLPGGRKRRRTVSLLPSSNHPPSGTNRG